MTAHTSTDDVLAAELEAIAAAAANRLRGEATGTGQDDPELQRALAKAASDAITAGLPLGAIADAERTGQQRAREELRPDVLRQITRAARRKRETEIEYEQAVIRGVRLGLGHRELAASAQVSHGTVRAIIARTDTSPGESAAAPELGHTNEVSSGQPPLGHGRPDGDGAHAAEDA